MLTLPGVNPVGSIQGEFETFYLYGAVQPLTGARCFLEFSHVDSVCFQAVLNKFSKTYTPSLNLLQLAKGSPQLAKQLIIPETLILRFQPAYRPDVNPIERVWQSVKDPLSWLTVRTLDELHREMEVVLNSLTVEGIASLTGYNFILSAWKKANLAA